MFLDVRRATLLALTCCLLLAVAAVPAGADGPAPLAGEFAQVSPSPTPGGEPPLSDEPEEPLGDDGDDSAGNGNGNGNANGAGSSGSDAEADDLPKTGADAGIIGLCGLGLLAMGCGLRLRLRADDGRFA